MADFSRWKLALRQALIAILAYVVIACLLRFMILKLVNLFN